MTEKEKAKQGLLYNANYDEELEKERIKAKEICYQYNQCMPSQIQEKEELIRKLFRKVGKRLLIEPVFYCDYGYHIEVGENFYANHNLVILDAADVVFGNDVFIGPNCGFYTAGHPLDALQRNEGLEYAKQIQVGDNVWFGGNVAVLPGVCIGNNVVIGAGSVVTKDIPDNVVAVGNPCKVLKQIGE